MFCLFGLIDPEPRLWVTRALAFFFMPPGYLEQHREFVCSFLRRLTDFILSPFF